MADTPVKVVFQAVDNMSGTVNSAANAMNNMGNQGGAAGSKVTASMNAASTSMNAMLERVTALSTAFTAMYQTVEIIGAKFGQMSSSLAALRDNSVQSAGEFQRAINMIAGINKVANPGQDMSKDLELIKAKAIEMGQTTLFSATKAAEAMVELTKQGYNTQQSIAGIAGVLMLAETEGRNTSEVASELVKILHAFGLSAESASHAADVLAMTSNSGATSMQELAYGISYVGPIAHAIGMSLEEASAYLGKFSDAGIDGSKAGTGLRRMIEAMVNPTEQQRNVMSKLGVEVAKNSSGNLDLTATLKRLQAAGISVSDVFRLFGVEGGNVAKVALESIPAIEELTKKNVNADGTLKTMNESIMSGVLNAFKMWQSSVETLLKVLADPFLGAISKVVNKMAEGVNVLISFFQKHQILAAVVGGVVTVLGLLAGGVAFLIGGLASLGLAFLGAAQAVKLLAQFKQQGIAATIKSMMSTKQDDTAHRMHKAAVDADTEAINRNTQAKRANAGAGGGGYTKPTLGGQQTLFPQGQKPNVPTTVSPVVTPVLDTKQIEGKAPGFFSSLGKTLGGILAFAIGSELGEKGAGAIGQAVAGNNTDLQGYFKTAGNLLGGVLGFALIDKLMGGGILTSIASLAGKIVGAVGPIFASIGVAGAGVAAAVVAAVGGAAYGVVKLKEAHDEAMISGKAKLTSYAQTQEQASAALQTVAKTTGKAQEEAANKAAEAYANSGQSYQKFADDYKKVVGNDIPASAKKAFEAQREQIKQYDVIKEANKGVVESFKERYRFEKMFAEAQGKTLSVDKFRSQMQKDPETKALLEKGENAQLFKKALQELKDEANNAKKALDEAGKAKSFDEQVDSILKAGKSLKTLSEETEAAFEVQRKTQEANASISRQMMDTELAQRKSFISSTVKSQELAGQQIAQATQETEKKKIDALNDNYNKTKSILEQEYATRKAIYQKMQQDESASEEGTRKLTELEKQMSEQRLANERKYTEDLQKELQKQYDARAQASQKIQELNNKIYDVQKGAATAVFNIKLQGMQEFDRVPAKMKEVSRLMQEAANATPTMPERAMQLYKEAQSMAQGLATDLTALKNNIRDTKASIRDTVGKLAVSDLGEDAKFEAQRQQVGNTWRDAKNAEKEGDLKGAEAKYKAAISQAASAAESAPEEYKGEAINAAIDAIQAMEKELDAVMKKQTDQAEKANAEAERVTQEAAKAQEAILKQQVEAQQRLIAAIDSNTQALQQQVATASGQQSGTGQPAVTAPGAAPGTPSGNAPVTAPALPASGGQPVPVDTSRMILSFNAFIIDLKEALNVKTMFADLVPTITEAFGNVATTVEESIKKAFEPMVASNPLQAASDAFQSSTDSLKSAVSSFQEGVSSVVETFQTPLRVEVSVSSDGNTQVTGSSVDRSY